MKKISLTIIIIGVVFTFFVIWKFYLKDKNFFVFDKTIVEIEKEKVFGELNLKDEKEDFNENIFFNSFPQNIEKINLLFFGDLMLDRYIFEVIQKHKPEKGKIEDGLDFVFAKFLKELFFDDYDLVVANLEGAVTLDGVHYPPVMGNDFAFLPAVVAKLRDYNFGFFNIANNHLSDQGDDGIVETRENLSKAGFAFSGCKDRKIDDCSFEILDISGKKFGMLGLSMVYGDFDLQKASLILENATTSDYNIVNIHWGQEYTHDFNKDQQKTAHILIEAGADVIIGHHPHVVQGIEIYQGKPIFYSLGNFIFDQPEFYFPPDNSEGLAVEISIKKNNLSFYLLPFKFKNWQLELMKDEEIGVFLENLCEWSDIDEEIKKKILSGVIEI